MSNLVIVAIPEENDYIWKISSEKVPHLTLLFLGESPSDVSNLNRIVGFVEHAANGLQPFWLDVDYRGTLGPDNADVVFFNNSWDMVEIADFRALLLQNDLIKMAYDSVEQYPEWQPHLTLGYPTAPAKPDDREYPGITSIRFDRIAVWTEDYAGPTFRLKPNYSMEVGLDTIHSDLSAAEKILEHHGVKGMRWGIRRKDPSGPSPVTVKVDHTKIAGKTKIKTAGGKGHPAHADAIAARVGQQKLRKSGIDTLSNHELQNIQTRLNLEVNVSRLDKQHHEENRNAVVKIFSKKQNRQQVQEIANTPQAKAGAKIVKKHLKKKVVSGLATAAIVA